MPNPAITDDQFWSLIDQARGDSSASADPGRLRAVLEPLGDEEIVDFGHMLYEKICDLNRWSLWAAGYVINGGLSDDGFHYFRTWIVGKGRGAFEAALQDPDTLGAFVDDQETENELLEYVALEILEERGVGEDPRERAERTADDEPAGEPFDEDTVDSQFPKLAAQFG